MTVYFPQLSQGLSAQFPIRKALTFRTVLNAHDRATALRAPDAGLERVSWRMWLRAIDDFERAAIESAFRATRGPLDPFVFLDPEGNLLRHSEDFAESSWTKSAGLSVASASSSPSAALSATRVTAPLGQSGEICQHLDLPCTYRWLLSIFARANQPATITMFVRSTNGEAMKCFALAPAWSRISLGGIFWSSGTGIDVGFRLDAGTEAEISAAQLESQLSPSVYKRTDSRSGVYPNARFAQDSLRITTLAPNCHQVDVAITAPISG